MRLIKLSLLLFALALGGIYFIYDQGSKPERQIEKPQRPVNAQPELSWRPAAIGPLNPEEINRDPSLLGDVRLPQDNPLPEVGPIKASMLTGDVIDVPKIENSAALPVVMAFSGELGKEQKLYRLSGKKKTVVLSPPSKWIVLLLPDPRGALDTEAALLSMGALPDNIKVIDNVVLLTDNPYNKLTPVEQILFDQKLLELDTNS